MRFKDTLDDERYERYELKESTRVKAVKTVKASEVSFPDGIYQVTSSFRTGMGSWGISCKVNDLLRFSKPDYEAEGFGSGIITNKMEKYDPIRKEWRNWKSGWSKYRWIDVKGAFDEIAPNITLIGKNDSSKKVKELMEPKALVFNNTKQAIAYLSNLPKRSKVRIEIQG